MDSSPSKRRRIDTSRSIQVNATNTSLDTDADHRRSSYGAPTRASLARSNPSLLAERDALALGDVQRESAVSALRGAPRGLNPTALRPKMTAPRLSASPTRETSSSPTRRPRTSDRLPDARRALSVPADEIEKSGEAQDEEDAASQVQEEVERSLLEEERLAATVSRRRKGVLTARGAFAPQTLEQPEPELPPTPAQLGLHKPPPRPAGVLSSSPHGKVSARKALPKSSPLKPRPIPVSKPPSSEAQPVTQDPNLSQLAVSGTAQEANEDIEDDPEVVERRQRLDQLSKQLQTLQSDVSFLQSQIRKTATKSGYTQSSIDRLVNILTADSMSKDVESSLLKPVSISTRLSAFLPFAKRPKAAPLHPLLEEEVLPSYKPTEGSEPMTYLEAFTPFKVSSMQTLTVVESESALLNQQQLSLSAMDLSLDLVLFSDTDTDTVEQVSLSTITPWADAELGSWIRRQAEETADMSSIGWGSSQYLSLARTRAQCWAKCRRTFPQYTSLTSAAAPSISESDREEDYMPHLGKPSLRLTSGTSQASLLISWAIELDWIGDVESRISATAALPDRWLDEDIQRDSFGKIPETFDRLVKKVGVFEAVKVLVGLVLGSR